jgi:hypothetical protein
MGPRTKSLMQVVGAGLLPLVAVLLALYLLRNGWSYRTIGAAAFIFLLSLEIVRYCRQRLSGQLAQFITTRIPADDDPSRAEQADIGVLLGAAATAVIAAFFAFLL